MMFIIFTRVVLRSYVSFCLAFRLRSHAAFNIVHEESHHANSGESSEDDAGVLHLTHDSIDHESRCLYSR